MDESKEKRHVEIQRIQNLPAVKGKKTVIDRIKDFFKKAKQESEIEKIANEMVTAAGMGFPAEKRMLIYDFFKNDIMTEDTMQKLEAMATINFINKDGEEKTFDIRINKNGMGTIEMDDSRIIAIEHIDNKGNGTINTIKTITEYLHLIEYDDFISSKTNRDTFLNEFGREVEKVMKKSKPNNKTMKEDMKLGAKLDKALRKNSVYMETKNSFDRAYKEYENKIGEYKREDENINRLRQELKVENIPQIMPTGTSLENSAPKKNIEYGEK